MIVGPYRALALNNGHLIFVERFLQNLAFFFRFGKLVFQDLDLLFEFRDLAILFSYLSL
jgi:hypothetical protein